MKIPENAAVRTAINDATFILSEAGIGNARGEARILAEHVLGHRPGQSERLNAEQYREFFSLIGERSQRVPLQHVMGIMYFRYLTLHARPGVFVARPETELVAEKAIEAARKWVERGVSPRVLDLGCGSGALGLSIASEVPEALLTSVDISPAAVALTEENARFVGVTAQVVLEDVTDVCRLTATLWDGLRDESGSSSSPAGSSSVSRESLLKGCVLEESPVKRSSLRREESNKSDLLGALPRQSFEGFHVIAANPPYVIDPVTQPEAIVDPRIALYGGGSDGLDLPRKFLVAAATVACPGATIVMEHGETQGEALVDLSREIGLKNAETHLDLAGRPRFLSAKV